MLLTPGILDQMRWTSGLFPNGQGGASGAALAPWGAVNLPTRFLEVWPYGSSAGEWNAANTGGKWTTSLDHAGTDAQVDAGLLKIPDGAPYGLPADSAAFGFPTASPQIDASKTAQFQIDVTGALPAATSNTFVTFNARDNANGTGGVRVTAYLQLANSGNLFAGLTGGGGGADINLLVATGATGYAGTMTITVQPTRAIFDFPTLGIHYVKTIAAAVPGVANDSFSLSIRSKRKGGAGNLLAITRLLAKGSHR
jgi:hypothetical protein